MSLEQIQDLLQMLWRFNNTAITHTFSTRQGEVITVKCIWGTYILEVLSSEHQKPEYFISLEKATVRIFEAMNSDAIS